MDLTRTYFLKLEIHDAIGKLPQREFLWLSTKPDVIEWPREPTQCTRRRSEFGDLAGLNSLPKAKVKRSQNTALEGEGDSMRTVAAVNKSNSVAFMVHPRLTRGKRRGKSDASFLEHNYFSLCRARKKSVTARCASASLHGANA